MFNKWWATMLQFPRSDSQCNPARRMFQRWNVFQKDGLGNVWTLSWLRNPHCWYSCDADWVCRRMTIYLLIYLYIYIYIHICVYIYIYINKYMPWCLAVKWSSCTEALGCYMICCFFATAWTRPRQEVRVDIFLVRPEPILAFEGRVSPRQRARISRPNILYCMDSYQWCS